MKRMWILVTLLALVVGYSAVQAEDDSLKALYEKIIDQKIEQRESQAKLAESTSEAKNLVCDGKTAADQAKFYRNNKERLVQEMLGNQIGDNRHRAEYFLIKAYFKEATHGILYACKQGD